jgi:hypothetical protein
VVRSRLPDPLERRIPSSDLAERAGGAASVGENDPWCQCGRCFGYTRQSEMEDQGIRYLCPACAAGGSRLNKSTMKGFCVAIWNGLRTRWSKLSATGVERGSIPPSKESHGRDRGRGERRLNVVSDQSIDWESPVFSMQIVSEAGLAMIPGRDR